MSDVFAGSDMSVDTMVAINYMRASYMGIILGHVLKSLLRIYVFGACQKW